MKAKTSVLCLVMALCFGACSDSGNSTNSVASDTAGSHETKVINGVPVDPLVSPQMVEVQSVLADGSTLLCSGVSIAAENFLTAGHCVPAGSIQTTVIVNGSPYSADKTTVHPQYSEAPELNAIFYDLAIVHVSGLALPTLGILGSVTLAPQAELIAYGFGLDSNGSAGTLNSGAVTVDFVTPNHIFSTPFDGSQAETCNGDSGGPVVYGYNDDAGNLVVGVVGLVSTGTVPGCDKGDVTLFTNLQNPAVLDFIAATSPDTHIF